MKAALFYGAGDIRIEEAADPAPGPGELLLEVRAAGICGTDVSEYVHGPSMLPITERHPVTGHVGPLILGHEFAGRVVAVGEGVSGIAVGALVASGAGVSCGECPQCRRGRTNLCVRYATVGLQRHGGLAQYCAVPAAVCVDVGPYGLDDETAALAQPMSIGVHAMRRGRLAPGEHAVVIGAGGIGAFLTWAAVQEGGHVTVVDLAADRLELARRLGAAETIQAGAGVDFAGELAERGVAPHVVYEVTGSAGALGELLAALLPGTRVVLVGLQNQPRELDLRRLTLSELELLGTNAHVCDADLPAAVRLLAARGDRWVDVAPVILPLDELVPEGILPMAESRSTRVKTLIDPWASEPRVR